MRVRKALPSVRDFQPCHEPPVFHPEGQGLVDSAFRIALINSLGDLGGSTGPYIIGWARQATGSYSGGLYGLAALALIAVFVTTFPVKVKKVLVEGDPATQKV